MIKLALVDQFPVCVGIILRSLELIGMRPDQALMVYQKCVSQLSPTQSIAALPCC